MIFRLVAIFALPGAAVFLSGGDWHPAQAADLDKQLREPVALVTRGEHLVTANRQSGTVSVIDAGQRRVMAEWRIGRELADLAAVPRSRCCLAVDEAAGELILFRPDRGEASVIERLSVPPSPVSLCVGPQGDLCSVASLWARQITLVEIARNASRPGLRRRTTLNLPFAPRKQCLIQDGKWLIVADSFGGNLAVIDSAQQEVLGLHTIDGHNIRGLVADDSRGQLHIAHQILNEQTATKRSRIFWGGVVGNVLRTVSYEEFSTSEKSEPQAIAQWKLASLGGPERGGGDPDEIILTPNGRTVVALSGVDKLAVREGDAGVFRHYGVGRRPTALALDPEERFLYVAETLDDSVSVFRLSDWAFVESISLGPQSEPNLLQRGRRLFYNARLSLDGWYSCHSCHTAGHTNGHLNDNLGDGHFGHPKRIPSLLGTGKTGPWAWDGSKPDLATQIRHSVGKTMRGQVESLEKADVEAIATYLRSLQPPPSLPKVRGTLSRDAVAAGRHIFRKRGCADCHPPPTYTSPATYDVGLQDGAGTRAFNPPSLRGLSQQRRFFHDNRADGLREVFSRFEHGDSGDLSDQEINNLLAFLRSL